MLSTGTVNYGPNKCQNFKDEHMWSYVAITPTFLLSLKNKYSN